ncbi:Transport protein particle subunit trs23 [Colletotrichum sp. SAR11_240]|nr:Transport protein particle subunit trs23 [Colletotrichum sp. SAR11_240]
MPINIDEKRPDQKPHSIRRVASRDLIRPIVMTVFALIVINKAGGLIYNRTFHDGGLNQLSTNDYLVLAGTFHGIHAITARLHPLKNQQAAAAAATAAAGGIPSRPEPPSGLEVMETENFRLQCFTTMTGTKFLLFTDTTQTNIDVILRRIYDLYSDYVMKNPFYQLEMPIRCEIFERKLLSYIREINNR